MIDWLETEEYLHVMCEYCGNEPATTSAPEDGEPVPACQVCADAAEDRAHWDERERELDALDQIPEPPRW